MDEKPNGGYTTVYHAVDKNDLLIKKSILESNCIPCSVKRNIVNDLFGFTMMPLEPEKGPGPLDLRVPNAYADQARALLSSESFESDVLPFIVLLDREHWVVTYSKGFPEGYIDTAADPEYFKFAGEYGSETCLYQFFLSKDCRKDIRLTDSRYAWQPLAKALSETGREQFREAYCSIMLAGYVPPTQCFSAFGFGPTVRSADKLGTLVAEGKKTGTSSLDWIYAAEEEKRPEPGDISVVLNGKGLPLAVIEATDVAIVPFCEVGEDHAAAEGEGNLATWRKIHWEVFGEECRSIGRTPDERMPVVCERFRVLETFT